MKEIFQKYVVYSIVARRPVARQQQRDKQIYNNRYRVTALQTNMFARQKLETATEERYFLYGPCWDVISRTVSWEPVSTLQQT
jgi:hypothetical protein